MHVTAIQNYHQLNSPAFHRVAFGVSSLRKIKLRNEQQSCFNESTFHIWYCFYFSVPPEFTKWSYFFFSPPTSNLIAVDLTTPFNWFNCFFNLFIYLICTSAINTQKLFLINWPQNCIQAQLHCTDVSYSLWLNQICRFIQDLRMAETLQQQQ